MKIHYSRSLLALLITSALAACGGGDSGGGNGGNADQGNNYSNNINPEDITFDLSGAISVITTDSVKSYSRASRQVTNFAAMDSDSTSQSNLFTMDANGNLTSLLSSPVAAKFAYTVQSPDGKYLYAALDANDLWSSQDLVMATNCAIFKISTSDNTTTCAYNGVTAASPYNFYNDLNDGRFKALQIDETGNLYFLKQEFVLETTVYDEGTEYESSWTNLTYDPYAGYPILTKLSTDGTLKTIGRDTQSISSFIVTPAGSLVYRDSSSSNLTMIPDLSNEQLSSVPLSSEWWGSGWYTIDDYNTVIYTSQDNLEFAQPSKHFTGGVEKRILPKYTNGQNEDYLQKIIAADDGMIYGVYQGSTYDNEAQTLIYTQSLRRIMPYSPDNIVTINIPNDYWNYWSNWNAQQIQIAEGYAYFIEEQNHTAYSKREVVGITKLDDGTTSYLFADEDWAAQRIDFESWKLVDDIIYFTGFNYANSKMVSGTIDTQKYLTGESTDQYLVLNETESSFNDSLNIADMVVVRAVKPESSDDTSTILEYITADEDIYSGTIRFTKWMDIASLNEAISIKNIDEATSADPMLLSLSNVVHVLYNTADSSAGETSQPLVYDTSYRITVDATKARDIDGISLENVNLSHDFNTRVESGYFASQVSDHSITSSNYENTYLKVFSNQLIINAFGDGSTSRQDLDHELTFDTKLTNGFYFYLKGSSSESGSYSTVAELMYNSLGKNYSWYTSDNTSNHTYGDLGFNSNEATISVKVVSDGTDINMTVTFTPVDEDETPVTITIDSPINDYYQLVFSSQYHGYESAVISVDNIKLVSNPDGTAAATVWEENFNSYADTDEMTEALSASNRFELSY